jgi:hypothetical protein
MKRNRASEDARPVAKAFRRLGSRGKIKAPRMIAYDFETTNISAGTPRPLYLTAFSTEVEFHIATKIRDMAHLRNILVHSFLTDALADCRFVAWNANQFDAYFIAAALLQEEGFIIRPYLTANRQLRGLRIIRSSDLDNREAPGWEFLDGMAMLGLAGVSLEKFARTFAPGHAKLTGAINWETESFDPDNADHRAYAIRDSEALFYAMQKAQAILVEYFEQALAPTMGNACIKIFRRHLPEGVTVRPMPEKGLSIIRDQVMRGGFCFCVGRFEGPIWKYDINQAYAAAMRDAALPQGYCFHRLGPLHPYAKIYIARVTGKHPGNRIPFYCKTEIKGRSKAVFVMDQLPDTWITSIEYAQLKREGWQLTVSESYFWQDRFSMRDYVTKLETLRMTCAGGPSGAIGTMVKAVGNHSYGKTVEQTDPKEIIFSAECPVGFMPYSAPGEEDALGVLEHIWWRVGDNVTRDYHKPELGAFITAHVRMVLRRAMLIDPEAWLYADTDCVAFSRDVTAALDIDPGRYGAWKIEESGTPYRIIAKKVYASLDGAKRSAKGLNVKRLTNEDFEQWLAGNPPTQTQTQRQNFVKVMAGSEMYLERQRRGTAIAL